MMATACQHCGANVSSKVENPFVHLILCSFIANRLRAALRCALNAGYRKEPHYFRARWMHRLRDDPYFHPGAG
jgi:hypothetical protein